MSTIQKELINAYDEINSNRKLIYDKNKTNIAIHLRVYNNIDIKEYYSKLRELKDIKLLFNDLDTFDTLHHLCKADVLYLGRSLFSILAGFYNKYTVIYLPYYYQLSLKSWLVYNPFN